MPAYTGDNMKNRPGNRRFKNPRWELFCHLYTRIPSKHYFGNATWSYLKAFDHEKRIDELEKQEALLESSVRNEDGVTEDGTSALAELDEVRAEIKTIKNTARTEGSTLLARPNVEARCNYLIDKEIDETETDREMKWTIMQREHLPSKVMAFQALAKVKGRLNAGSLEGKFEFGWEKEDGVSKPKSVKVTIKKQDDDGDVADFQE